MSSFPNVFLFLILVLGCHLCFKKCSGGESGFVLLFKSPSSHISELFLEGVPGEANVDFPGADLLGQLLVQPPVVHHILPLLTNLETACQETDMWVSTNQLDCEQFLEVEVSEDQLKNIRVETSLGLE